MKFKSTLLLVVLTLFGYVSCKEESKRYYKEGVAKMFVAAAKNCRLEEVKSLVDKYEDDGGIPAYKQQALVCAAEKGCKEIVEYLIEKDVDINGCYAKKTALMCAQEKGFKDIASLLLENGAY